jgi:hypothetical protein
MDWLDTVLAKRCPIEFDEVNEVKAIFQISSGFTRAEPVVLSTATPYETEFGCGAFIEDVKFSSVFICH